MTLEQFFEAIDRGETTEQYNKRIARIKRLVNEREALEDAIEILGDDPRANKKRSRLAKVVSEIQALK